jgi:anti-sigma B factor antagonist
MQEFHLETIGPVGDCAVLRVVGEVDVFTAPALRERLRELAANGVVHMVADMRGVDFLDSSGLGVLVGGLKRVREHGGSLTVVVTSTRILQVLEITGLSRVLPPRASVADAIDADPDWRQTAENDAGSVKEWCRRHDLL